MVRKLSASNFSRVLAAGGIVLFWILASSASTILSSVGDGAQRVVVSVGVIVSVCKEPQTTLFVLKGLLRELRDSGYEAKLYIYCKCGPWYTCDRTILNVGREGHTFVTHIVQDYAVLDDIIWFVNGGFLSKLHAKATFYDIHRMLTNLRFQRHLAKHVYMDDSIKSFDRLSYIETKVSASAKVSCLAIAQDHCESFYKCEYTLPCVSDEACACSIQRQCQWTGATKENYNATVSPMLAVPPPDGDAPRGHSMYTWACSRLHLNARLLHRCGASRSGVFAVGSERIRAYPKYMYESLAKEYDAYSTSGGLMGHYMERLYRSLFFCALADMRITTRPLQTLEVWLLHTKRAIVHALSET